VALNTAKVLNFFAPSASSAPSAYLNKKSLKTYAVLVWHWSARPWGFWVTVPSQEFFQKYRLMGQSYFKEKVSSGLSLLLDRHISLFFSMFGIIPSIRPHEVQ